MISIHNKWVRVHDPEERDVKRLLEDFHLEEGPIRDALDPFEVPRLEVSTKRRATFFVQLFSLINNSYQVFITSISKKVRGMLYRIEEILNDFLSALITTNTALNNLLSKKFIDFPEEDHDLIEDTFLGTGQLIEHAKSNLKNIVNIREAYTTIMSQDLIGRTAFTFREK